MFWGEKIRLAYILLLRKITLIQSDTIPKSLNQTFKFFPQSQCTVVVLPFFSKSRWLVLCLDKIYQEILFLAIITVADTSRLRRKMSQNKTMIPFLNVPSVKGSFRSKCQDSKFVELIVVVYIFLLFVCRIPLYTFAFFILIQKQVS